MSGNALGPYNIPTKDPYALAKKQAEQLNIKPTNSLDLIEKLRKLSAFEIINSIDGLKV